MKKVFLKEIEYSDYVNRLKQIEEDSVGNDFEEIYNILGEKDYFLKFEFVRENFKVPIQKYYYQKEDGTFFLFMEKETRFYFNNGYMFLKHRYYVFT